MLKLGEKEFRSRMLMGTSNYPSFSVLKEAIEKAGAEVVTLSLRRQMAGTSQSQQFFEMLKEMKLALLPNTANCRSVKEAVTTAHMAREIFSTNWIKLETLGDEYTLQPDPFALVEAARILCSEGFEVFPYTTEDLVVAERLLAAGCRILMPWAAPIGSGQGLLNKFALRTLRSRLPDVPMIIDAGIGAPSQAAEAMEMGFDAVLLNTAIADSVDQVAMAESFSMAISAGYKAYKAGLMYKKDVAQASTPTIGTPFWKVFGK